MKSRSLAAVLCCLGGSLISTASLAQQIYTNGPFITNPGAHVSGGDVSLAQDVTYPGYTMLGMNAGPDFRAADDFVVPINHVWTINSVTLYAYQTGSADADFTDARVIIWTGQPDGFGSFKRYDGSVANGLVSTTPVAYRTAQSFDAPPYSNTERRVVALTIAIPPLELRDGLYWLDWQLKGPDAAASVFTPPVSIIGQPYTAFDSSARRKCPASLPSPNSCQTSPNQWQVTLNGTAQYLVDMPFLIHGVDIVNLIFKDGFETPVPAP